MFPSIEALFVFGFARSGPPARWPMILYIKRRG